MMTDAVDVLIVGGGLEGLSTAWAVSERSVGSVRLLERSSLCGGMTGKSSGVIRCHYGVPSLAAMAKYGVEVFQQAEDLLGGDIGYRRTGYLVMVGPEGIMGMHLPNFLISPG